MLLAFLFIILLSSFSIVLVDYNKSHNDIQGLTAVAIILTVVVPIFTALFVSWSLTKPIKRFKGVVSRAGTGDYSQRIAVSSKDEVAELAEVFNHMIDNVAASQKTIKEERDHLQAVLKSIGDGIFVIDRDRNVILMNPVAERILGVGFGQIADKKLDNFFAVYKDDQRLETTQRPSVKVMETGITMSFGVDDDLCFASASGKRFPVSMVVTPLRGDGVTGAVVAFRDITAEKQTTETIEREVKTRTAELVEERARFLSSIKSLHVGFLVIDLNSDVVVANQAVERIFGFERGRWGMKDVAAALAGSFDIAAKCHECIVSRKAADFKDISYGAKFLRIFITPIITEQDNVIGTAILVEDITEQKIAERSKDEFFSIASHELRTPLTSIKGNSSMILNYYSAILNEHKDLGEMMADIHESSDRLISIVNDFLDLSRLEQGKVVFKPEAFSIEEIVESVAYEMKSIVTEKGIFLRFDGLVLGKLPKIWADKNRTKQIVYNLVGNAMKFTESGGVTISAAANGDLIKVIVSDTGKGISANAQQLLFHKFQQAGNSILTRDNTHGTGLGLYISKMLAEKMGGAVALDNSEVGKGSSFSFSLPLADTTNI